MAITKAGFHYVGELDGNTAAAAREYTVTDSTAIAAGDAVALSSGKVILATTNLKLWGVALESASSALTGEKIKVQLFTPTAVFKAQSDGADFTVASIGMGFDIIATTGAQGIDVSDATANKQQMLCIGLDPNDASMAYFICQESQLNAAALVA